MASEQNWVVRGGITTARQLIEGAREHLAVPGLFGFSVQYQPGHTVRELAIAGHFPHRHISVVPIEALVAAAEGVGYNLRILKSPGIGFHHTVETPFPLTNDLAGALSSVFSPISNPARYFGAERD